MPAPCRAFGHRQQRRTRRAARAAPAAGRLGRVSTRAYDPLNRLLQETAPDGARTAYGYDALDQLIQAPCVRIVVASI